MMLTQPNAFPENIYTVSLFIYLGIFLVFVEWLYGQYQAKLSIFSERLSLGLGLILSLMASFNPVARSLNLVLSTITLSFLAYRRTSRFRVYFAQIVSLICISATLDWLLSHPSQREWIIIFLAMTISELILSIFVKGIHLNFFFEKIIQN
jgi:hypothetical protein